MVSIDFIRGFAIFIMVILHLFLRMTNLDWVFDFSQLFEKNIAIIIIVILLGYLGTFAGLFLLISITVNVFSAHKKLDKGIS
ncbi:MAG: hypothetical protein FK731_07970, partial [Asgard group archaeon]|nr:hypothetical protein [Asgard group archaeon]